MDIQLYDPMTWRSMKCQTGNAIKKARYNIFMQNNFYRKFNLTNSKRLYDNSDQSQIRTQFWNWVQIISQINLIT